jgi:hypothetical protein
MYMKHALFGALAAVILSTSAFAGAPIHRMPAAVRGTESAYQLKLVGAPVSGKPLVLALTDANGRTVDGTVAMLRPIWRGVKAFPMIQNVPVALTRDAAGDFVCAHEHRAGDAVAFRAFGPDGKTPVWLTVTVNG